MSLSAVPRAAKQGNQSATEVVALAAATAPRAKCFPPYAPSVVKKPKCRLNLAVVDRYIVAIVTVKSDRIDNAGLTLRTYLGWESGLRIFLEYGGGLCH